ncbi:MAG: carbohydrate ABC transporter permease [Acidimicrobiales bacterium]
MQATEALSATIPGERQDNARRRRITRRVIRYAVLIIAAGIVLFPIYITLIDALLSPQQITHRPPYLFPPSPHWSTFSTAFKEGDLGIYLRNSAIVTIAVMVFEIVTSVLAAYAFVFLRFPFRKILFFAVLATLMVPAEATIIPNYQTIDKFGLLNTFPALILPFLANGIGIFLFRQAFLSFPSEIQDAAQLDGCGHLKFLFRIVVPINRPVIGAFGLFAFLTSWNQYLWPLVVTQTNSVRTVQIGLRQLSGLSFSQFDVLFAGTILAFAPIAILLIVFQRQLVAGLTAGAVKG